MKRRGLVFHATGAPVDRHLPKRSPTVAHGSLHQLKRQWQKCARLGADFQSRRQKRAPRAERPRRMAAEVSGALAARAAAVAMKGRGARIETPNAKILDSFDNNAASSDTALRDHSGRLVRR